MLYSVVENYLQSRLSDPEFGGWLAGSVAALASAYYTAPGRSLEKRLPPPKMARILVEPPMQRSDGLALPQYSVMEKFVFLWRIAFSSRKSREYRTVIILTVLIILRTIVSVRMVKNVGAFSTACINGNMRELMRAVGAFLLSSLPAVGLNVSLSYYSQMLELYLRTNLSRYFHRRYLTPKVFFRLAGLHEVEHVDQRITEDVQRWASVTAALCTTISRPLCEAITFSALLGRRAGIKALGMTWGYYLGFMALSFYLAPNVDWLASQRMEKEGAFRAAHQNLLSYAEEICLSTRSGLAFQRNLLNQRFQAVTDQSRYAAFVHAKFNLVEGLYNKYGSILLSYLVAGVAARNAPAGEMASCFSSTSYIFRLLSQAISRLLWNIKLILAANGYTQRLFQLVEGLELAQFEVDRQSDMTSRSPLGSMRNLDASLSILLEQQSALSTFGRVIHGEHIEFFNVPLITPSGEVLCPSLSFYVQPGMNVLIMGPNGCGKSSTFRLLGELWPLRGGRMIKPEHDQLYYVPQRPYMYDGTLLEQVIYPLKRSEVDVGESTLYEYMEMAHLQHVFERPNVTWDSHLSWSDDTFSAGEKQRLAMARLFFHRPRFAILDECSSLLDEDVEADLYRSCRELGISLITIAHRRSVWAHHNWILYFDGNGGYMFSPFKLEDKGTQLVFLNVESSNDTSILTQCVKVPVAPLWEDDLESTQVPI